MPTYQFSVRAYPRGKFDHEQAAKIAKSLGATHVKVRAAPRMWECNAETARRTMRTWIGYNQPETVQFRARDDEHAREIKDAYNTEIAFVESFAGHYV